MRLHRSRSVLVVLALLLAAEAAPAGVLMLCQAGDHAAVESPAEAALCRGDVADARTDAAGAALSPSPLPCVDTPLFEPAPPSRLVSDAGVPPRAALGIAFAPTTSRAASLCAFDCAAAATADRVPRLLRAVVLVV